MADDDHRELLIIRKRHNVEEEDHHGGVWKLAFADFMTAMMAFFLVMWLINSTTKETKATIVQYFNPVQLVDSNEARKGLRDPKDAGQGKSVKRSSVEDKSSPTPSKAKDGSDPLHEAALLYNPAATLEEIANSSTAPESEDTAPITDVERPAFGDPFDRTERKARNSGQSDEEKSRASEGPAQNVGAEGSPPSIRPLEPSGSTGPKPMTHQQRPPALSVEEKSRSEPNAFASLRSEVEKILKLEGAGTRNAPHVEVTESDEGLLINLTDDANFSMFSVGSVEPRPQLVRILAQIGRVLAQRPGEIELRGHTDGRSYKSATYDNWRLSADRANMAFYMLVRGGLAEKRVVKISGYADRHLKTPKDPLAANNRRIEILLRRAEH